MAAQDRGRAGGHREDGPPGASSHLARAGDPLVDGRRADLPDVHQQVRRLRRVHAPRAPRTASRTTPGADRHEPGPTDPGLPAPPAGRAPSALPAGTFDGACVFVTGGGTGLGKAIAARVRAARRGDRHRQPQARAPRGRARPRSRRSARRWLAVACDIRDAEQIAAAFDAAESAFGLPDVLDQQRGRELPGARRGHVAERVAHRRRHHAQRHVLLRARVRPAPPRGAARPGSIINVGASYAWTGGPGFAHRAAAKAGVKNMVETLAVEWGPYGIQVNGLVPGLFPHEDMTADIRGNLDRTDDKDAVPARAARRRSCRSWAGRRRSWRRPTPGSSPATRWWSTARTGSGAV